MTVSRSQRTLERKARRLRNRLRAATKSRDCEAEVSAYEGLGQRMNQHGMCHPLGSFRSNVRRR